MKALIIDDERLARFEMLRLLKAHPEIEVAGEAADGDAALQLIESVDPDLLFLDIEMPGMSGFDLLDRLQNGVPQVIFTTAFDAHAIKAFEVNAIDYLLKPIAPQRLEVALSRLAYPGRSNASQVFVRDGDNCWIVRQPEIVLLESEGNYTRVHFREARPLIRRSLNALERKLDGSLFFRANRKQILNLSRIERTTINFNGSLTAILGGGRTVVMSRRQSDRLRTIMGL